MRATGFQTGPRTVPGSRSIVRTWASPARRNGSTWYGVITEAAFSPADDRLLCVLEDEIVWVRWPEVRPTSRLRLDFGTGIRGSPTGLQTAFGAQPGEVWFLGEDSRLYRWDGADACTVVAEQTDDTKPSCRVEEFTVRAADGLELPVQRLIPAAPASVAVVYVHGGPGGTLDPDDTWAMQLVASGYEAVRVAYRGSSGYGERLTTANTGWYGVSDVDDVIHAGVWWQRPSVVAVRWRCSVTATAAI